MSDDEMTTKPTIDTLLARLDEWGARFTNELTKVNAGQAELRDDLNAGLRRVERKIEILNDNLLTIKADIRDLEVRIEKIESEPVAKS
jgi:predicted  nucleic acid-binding Zn-ribbon protein